MCVIFVVCIDISNHPLIIKTSTKRLSLKMIKLLFYEIGSTSIRTKNILFNPGFVSHAIANWT